MAHGATEFSASLPNRVVDKYLHDLKMRSVSVIVPCTTFSDALRQCLASIADQDLTLPMQTIIVVNGHNTGEFRSLRGATVVFEPVRGPAAARNAGVGAATGDVLAFTDSDCIADPSWLACGLRALGEVSCRMIVAGSIARFGSRHNSISLYDSVTFLQQENYVKGAGAFVTANLIVHRKIFELLGPFDPIFNEAAFEDWDWALRARHAGIQIRYEPGAIVQHPCMSRLSELKAKSERLARGEIIFARKHKHRMKRRSLLKTTYEHARRAWKNIDLPRVDRVRIASISILAAFWRWNAFETSLPAARRARLSMFGK